MRKCILISEETWTKLMHIKINHNFKSLNDVILFLLNNSANNLNDTLTQLKKEIDVIKTRIEDLEERVFANP